MIRARRTILGIALLLVAALAIAGPAAAKDRNDDRIPDRWEKRHDLSLKVKQTRRDQDRDGLKNMDEFRSDSDPREDDSDDDGTEDGDENAGVITAFDGETLTIDLFGGGSVTGTVDESTEVKCGEECGHDGDDDESDDDEVLRHGDNSGPGSDSSGPGPDGDGQGDDDDRDGCSIDDLAVDVTVHEAELELEDGEAVFEEIELAR
jgi:hypothetical protein